LFSVKLEPCYSALLPKSRGVCKSLAMTSPGPPRRPKPPREELSRAVEQIRAEDAAITAAQQAMTDHRREKRRIVRELYMAGWSYPEIAEALGVSVQRVYNLASKP
jgi:DNA-directed RNA polymerase specialized sigma24 family protein